MLGDGFKQWLRFIRSLQLDKEFAKTALRAEPQNLINRRILCDDAPQDGLSAIELAFIQ